jgi:hypothetical protein
VTAVTAVAERFSAAVARFVGGFLAVLAIGGFLIACGNESSDGDAGEPPSQTVNPCPTPAVQPLSQSEAVQQRPSKTPGVLLDPDPRTTIFNVFWNQRSAILRGTLAPLPTVTPAATMDVGDVAVVQDEGDLIDQPNTFDLQSRGLRFVPRAGGFDIVRIDPGFRSQIGDRVTLGDDDSVEERVPFSFPYFGSVQSDAFVNSDGNITFGEADRSSSDRDIARLVSGAPRVAPFLADLDPSAGGAVFVRAAADAFTATWCGVRVFDSTLQVTLQTSLLPDGSVEMKYADSSRWTATDGIVGVSPGHTGTFQPVDLTAATTTAPVAGGSGAVGERFAQRGSLELVSVARKFYQTHPDAYDQLVVWTDTRLTDGNTFSFEVTVANDIEGIGVDRFDTTGDFGSAGRLRSMVQMDDISKFPADPTTKFLGENNTLSVLGQEVGHQWLAFLQFSDVNRQPSDALLGRDKAHWSFFFNSDASVMEGNRIEDLGGGSFRTVAAVEKYSLLDQYAMGLVRDIDVPRLFYVENPTNVVPPARAESAPRLGVTFNGTRRDVLINDIIEVMGPRRPTQADSPKVHHQAFLFVVGRGRTADPAVVAKIDRIRRAWEGFFTPATDGRGRAETRLFPPM